MPEISLLPVDCNNCGAPITLPEGTRFATCRRCGSKLEIHRGPEAVYSAVVEAMSTQNRIQGQELRLRQITEELEALDRGWEQERGKFIDFGRQGEPITPSRGSITGGMVTGIAFGGLFLLMSAVVSSWGAGPISYIPTAMGLLVMGISIFSGMSSLSKADRYQEAETLHQHKRQKLMQELEALR